MPTASSRPDLGVHTGRWRHARISIATWLSRALTLIGALCLGTWIAVTAWSRIEVARNEHLLAREIENAGRQNPAVQAPLAPLPAPGALLGRVEVPRVGVSAIVLEGTSSSVLAQGAGHVRGTAYPGGAGNVVIAAHRDSFFRNLRRIKVGDVVSLTTPAGRRSYAVRSIAIVTPDDLSVLAPGQGSAALTLITCYPFQYIGAAPKRFVVRAIARPTPAPPS